VRLALVVERFEPGAGGVENAAFAIARGLARAGDRVSVIARRAAPGALPGIRLERVAVPSAWQPLRAVAFSRAAARAARRGGYDLVYSLARTEHQDVYRAGAGCHLDYLERRYAGAALRLRRLSPRHAALLALERRALGGRTRVVECRSEMVRAQLLRRYGLPPERCVCLPGGVDLAAFHPARREAEGAALRRALGAGAGPVWLFAGSGFARKGLDVALRALAAGPPREAQLWIAGADPPGPWRRLARALGVGGRARFLGFRRDLPALFAAADALLLPTRYDAFANVCLEAAAAGLPVATSRANGAAELLAGCGPAPLEPEDVAGFAAALDALAERGARERWGAAARAVAERCGWETHVAALRALFTRVLKEREAGAAPAADRSYAREIATQR
jgi:UDP-glucose:(heptosyl)LPS alpha-1,3-glucosyltransferase